MTKNGVCGECINYPRDHHQDETSTANDPRFVPRSMAQDHGSSERNEAAEVGDHLFFSAHQYQVRATYVSNCGRWSSWIQWHLLLSLIPVICHLLPIIKKNYILRTKRWKYTCMWMWQKLVYISHSFMETEIRIKPSTLVDGFGQSLPANEAQTCIP